MHDYFLFLGRNFQTRNARKLVKGSKNSDYSLVSSKNLSQKFTSTVSTQGQVTWAIKV